MFMQHAASLAITPSLACESSINDIQHASSAASKSYDFCGSAYSNKNRHLSSGANSLAASSSNSTLASDEDDEFEASSNLNQTNSGVFDLPDFELENQIPGLEYTSNFCGSIQNSSHPLSEQEEQMDSIWESNTFKPVFNQRQIPFECQWPTSKPATKPRVYRPNFCVSSPDCNTFSKNHEEKKATLTQMEQSQRIKHENANKENSQSQFNHMTQQMLQNYRNNHRLHEPLNLLIPTYDALEGVANYPNGYNKLVDKEKISTEERVNLPLLTAHSLLNEAYSSGDYEDDELLRPPRNLYSVGDIIGYAKVVRALRNDALGQLNTAIDAFNDVWSIKRQEIEGQRLRNFNNESNMMH